MSILSEIHEARSLGIEPRPVLIDPVKFLASRNSQWGLARKSLPAQPHGYSMQKTAISKTVTAKCTSYKEKRTGENRDDSC